MHPKLEKIVSEIATINADLAAWVEARFIEGATPQQVWDTLCDAKRRVARVEALDPIRSSAPHPTALITGRNGL